MSSRMRTIIFFILTFTCIDGFAQKTGDKCLEQLKDLYAKMNRQFNLDSDKVFYLNYTVSTTLSKRNGGQHHETAAELYANSHKSYLISQEIEVYEDEKTVVSIMPAKKIIFLNNSTGGIKEAKIKHLHGLQDTLFSFSSVEYCGNVTLKDGINFKKIILKVNQTGRKLFGINTLEFIVNEEGSNITQILVVYNEINYISKMKVFFETVDYNHKSSLLDKSPLAQVTGNDGKLLKRFRAYKLIDQRRK